VASEVRPGRNPPVQHNLSQVSDRYLRSVTAPASPDGSLLTTQRMGVADSGRTRCRPTRQRGPRQQGHRVEAVHLTADGAEPPDSRLHQTRAGVTRPTCTRSRPALGAPPAVVVVGSASAVSTVAGRVRDIAGTTSPVRGACFGRSFGLVSGYAAKVPTRAPAAKR
jgi:hypothetical protein